MEFFVIIVAPLLFTPKQKHHYTYTWEFSFVKALLIWVGGFGSIYYFLQNVFEYLLIKFSVLSFIFFSIS